MKAVLCGANGAMGQLISGILGDEVVGRVSLDGANGVARTFRELGRVEADVVIDFSHHSSAADVLDYAKEIGAAAVIGTTGHTTEEKQMIFDAAQEIPVFYSGNMSLGIALLCQLTRQTVALFPEADVEIVEIHHNRKVDAPSGTAPMPSSTMAAAANASGKRTRWAFPPCAWAMWWGFTRCMSAPPARPLPCAMRCTPVPCWQRGAWRQPALWWAIPPECTT